MVMSTRHIALNLKIVNRPNIPKNSPFAKCRACETKVILSMRMIWIHSQRLYSASNFFVLGCQSQCSFFSAVNAACMCARESAARWSHLCSCSILCGTAAVWKGSQLWHCSAKRLMSSVARALSKIEKKVKVTTLILVNTVSRDLIKRQSRSN